MCRAYIKPYTVYTWDCRKYFQHVSGTHRDKRHDHFDLELVSSECTRWMNEIPDGAFVAVLHTASSYIGLKNGPTLSLNLLGILMLCAPPAERK